MSEESGSWVSQSHKISVPSFKFVGKVFSQLGFVRAIKNNSPNILILVKDCEKKEFETISISVEPALQQQEQEKERGNET